MQDKLFQCWVWVSQEIPNAMFTMLHVKKEQQLGKSNTIEQNKSCQKESKRSLAGQPVHLPPASTTGVQALQSWSPPPALTQPEEATSYFRSGCTYRGLPATGRKLIKWSSNGRTFNSNADSIRSWQTPTPDDCSPQTASSSEFNSQHPSTFLTNVVTTFSEAAPRRRWGFGWLVWFRGWFWCLRNCPGVTQVKIWKATQRPGKSQVSTEVTLKK